MFLPNMPFNSLNSQRFLISVILVLSTILLSQSQPEIFDGFERRPTCKLTPWSKNSKCERPRKNECLMAHWRTCLHIPSNCVCDFTKVLKETIPRESCFFTCPKEAYWAKWNEWYTYGLTCIRERDCKTGGGDYSMGAGSCVPFHERLENKSMIDSITGDSIKCAPTWIDKNKTTLIVLGVIGGIALGYYLFRHGHQKIIKTFRHICDCNCLSTNSINRRRNSSHYEVAADPVMNLELENVSNESQGNNSLVCETRSDELSESPPSYEAVVASDSYNCEGKK